MLNPSLYQALRHKFANVAIHNENARAAWVDIAGRVRITYWGECYSVACPYCDDTKSHLWISYLWGHTVGRTNKTRVYPAHCYRRGCMANAYNRADLRRRIQYQAGPLVVATRASAPVNPRIEVDLPPECIPLTTLRSEHPAREYVRRRGYDEEWVWRRFKVHVVPYCPASVCSERLVIPYFCNGKAVGWSARTYVEAKPKYLFPKGVRIHRFFYNMDDVGQAQHVIIVEGPFDVWRVTHFLEDAGLDTACAVAASGKSLTYDQCELITNWKRSGKKIWLCYDADAANEARRYQAKLHVHAIIMKKGDPDDNLDAITRTIQEITAT